MSTAYGIFWCMFQIKHCFVRSKDTSALQHPVHVSLPNGTTLSLSAELRCDVAEALFNRYQSDDCLPSLIASVIGECHERVQPLLWGNIVVCGGNSLFPGFIERLREDLDMIERKLPISVNRNDSAEGHVRSSWNGVHKIAASSFIQSRFA
jgi:hypothetical protein